MPKLERDILCEVLTHIHSPRHLAIMSRVNRTARQILRDDRYWTAAAKHMCGEKFIRPLPANTPHASNQRYIAMLRICPWLSWPRIYRFDHRAEETHEYMELADVENVSINDDELSVLLSFQDADGTLMRAMVCPLIPRIPSMTVKFRKQHALQTHSSDELFDLVFNRLVATGLLPEELLEIFSTPDAKRILKIVPLHRAALAIYSERQLLSDVYIFDGGCTRLLRRIRTPRDTLRLLVVCRGPVLVVVTNTTISTYAPTPGMGIRLRDTHPA